jgi:hypothetical protein
LKMLIDSRTLLKAALQDEGGPFEVRVFGV